jgi:hypothetical protein
VTRASIETFRRRVCTCSVPPDRCVPDATVLVQYSSDGKEFRNRPRIDRETCVSVLMADGWSLAKVSEYVRRASPTRAILERAGMRSTTAGTLRAAGFAVVHTPGAIVNGPHVSVVWPGAQPLDQHVATWSPEVSAKFDSCFNGHEV